MTDSSMHAKPTKRVPIGIEHICEKESGFSRHDQMHRMIILLITRHPD